MKYIDLTREQLETVYGGYPSAWERIGYFCAWGDDMLSRYIKRIEKELADGNLNVE